MKEERFISLLNDTTFKYLWKNERGRKYLEKVISTVTGIDLSSYELIDNELNSGNEIKDYRLDILLKKDNQLVNIEMNQFVSNYTGVKNHSYLYRLAGNLYEEGDDYNIKKNIVQINFNNCYCKDNKGIGISVYEFIDKRNDLKIEGVKIIEIYLSNYRGICYTNDNEKESYLSLFTAKSYDEMRYICGNNKEMREVMDEIEKLNRDKYFGGLYDASIVQKKCENSARNEGREDGIKEGLIIGEEIGVSKTNKEIAKAMLEKGMDISLISEITKLKSEEIELLK